MSIICLGEALIDFVALETGVSVADASGFLKAPGGAPANVAVGVARLGVKSAFLGKVGNDPFGICLRDTLASNGVDVRGLCLDSRARTGLAFVSLQADGERDFCFFRNPSADMLYRPEEVDADLIRSSRIFHFGSITLIQEPSLSATLEAARVAREAGLIVSYDPNLRPPLWPSLEEARHAILDTIPLADVLKVSEEELVFLTGEESLERGMARLIDRGPNLRLIAVTRGARGCEWQSRTASGSNPAFGVDAMDTTGAGDGFVAGLLVQLLIRVGCSTAIDALDRREMSRMARYANAVGALTCMRRGAIPGLPTGAEVDAFLAARTERDAQSA